MKIKPCNTCKKEVTIAFRVRLQKGGSWVFVCEDCCNEHKSSTQYTYGGTWKGKKH